jgi:hypothetical protein
LPELSYAIWQVQPGDLQNSSSRNCATKALAYGRMNCATDSGVKLDGGGEECVELMLEVTVAWQVASSPPANPVPLGAAIALLTLTGRVLQRHSEW